MICIQYQEQVYKEFAEVFFFFENEFAEVLFFEQFFFTVYILLNYQLQPKKNSKKRNFNLKGKCLSIY